VTKKHEVFLSYSSIDRVYAEKLAHDLQGWGLSVWWDRWEIKVGDSLNDKIQEGRSASCWLAVILTPDSVRSPWVQRELNSGLIQELEERAVVVLPLLFRDCELPLFLRDKLYADFRTSYDDGLQRLLERLAPIQPDVVGQLMSEESTRILSAYSHVPAANRAGYVEHLLARLSNPDSAQRRAALHAVWTIDSSKLPTALLAASRDSASSLRRQAAFIMGETRDALYERAVSYLMSDKDPEVRQAARTALSKIERGAKPVR
jgi:hypothetical protein